MISPTELEELANLYDLGAHSLDPTDARAMQALDEFEAKLERLFISFTSEKPITFRDFRRAVIGQMQSVPQEEQIKPPSIHPPALPHPAVFI